MADYLITGKKGSGKSIFAIGLIRDALLAGKRVATNLDVKVEKLLPASSRATLIRLPDLPNVEDMESLGRGQDGVLEDQNGLIIVDEASMIFNARAWGDKGRQPFLDWLVHSRKMGWDTYWIAQGVEQLDKQLRSTLLEYRVNVTRTDKWPIPGITALGRVLGLDLTMPKMHIGTVRYGMERDALVIRRHWYKGIEIYPAYSTQQVFVPRDHPAACGMHSVLSAWHVHGRYLVQPPGWRDHLWSAVCLVLAALAVPFVLLWPSLLADMRRQTVR